MKETLNGSALDLLFKDARTSSAWHDKQVPETLLREIWDLAKLGPTSANGSPARVVFVVSAEAKNKLVPCLIGSNVDKTMSASATAIIGYDMAFYDKLPELFPHMNARAWFFGNERLISDTAFRNGTPQGTYLMLAARALGLDCGPMSGFDYAAVDATFFSPTQVCSNFLCNLGYGTDEGVFPRIPCFTFDDACKAV